MFPEREGLDFSSWVLFSAMVLALRRSPPLSDRVCSAAPWLLLSPLLPEEREEDDEDPANLEEEEDEEEFFWRLASESLAVASESLRFTELFLRLTCGRSPIM